MFRLTRALNGTLCIGHKGLRGKSSPRRLILGGLSWGWSRSTTGAAIRNELWDLYVKESAAIEQDFSANGDGRAALSRRTALVDSIVQRLWNEIILGAVRDAHATADAPAKSASTSAGLDGPKNFTLVATGGFGRGWLFPIPTSTFFFCTLAAAQKMNLRIRFAGSRRSCGNSD